MTVNDIIKELQRIPSRDRERPIVLCGDLINRTSDETIDNFKIEWIDCSDGIVLLFNKDERL